MHTNQELLESIIAFARSDEAISALMLIGSQARVQKPADEYSDIDLIVVTDEPEKFIASDAWLAGIANHHISFVETTVDGQKEKRVLFDNALDVDFVIVTPEHAEHAVQSEGGMELLKNGYRILVNKSGLTVPPLIDSPGQGYPAPCESAFANTVNDFWYHAVWTAKKLLRKARGKL